MKAKYNFSEPRCSSMPCYKTVGNGFNDSRYCEGFPKKGKSKRFKTSDPVSKAPKWCPKRLPTPVCRIYGFKDEQSEFIELMKRRDFDPKTEDYIHPDAFHYKFEREFPISMTANDFFKATRKEPLSELFPNEDLDYGQVLEIDNGLRAYAFYYFDFSTVIPVLGFVDYHCFLVERDGKKHEV